ncbi:DUF2894 domain-containing protein [Limnohabitans sp. 15K]|uniref:DUF2894 domain-containing protein n=1 Tax=Limnohabitans sp. 15K TaxID=1100706 RepID=UPI000C1F21B9|nr:DUF2894 domain-containing protein [Limnohabitans sp. 15K]PIT81761.1 hypothetical protein B9Z40_09100 [Limnohabitans sp. 15K]
MNEAAPALPDLDAMRAAGAARVDAVGWHYIETLANRTQAQSGPARLLLHAKLQEALQRFNARMTTAAQTHAASEPLPSPLATLLQDMGPKTAPPGSGKTAGWPSENPRIQAFKKQLSQISVQKQVTQAIAQAPQNAGPINSHMLVLRSLGLMRDISPDYLNRFMAHVDTLLCLEEAGNVKLTPKRAMPSAKTRS